MNSKLRTRLRSTTRRILNTDPELRAWWRQAEKDGHPLARALSIPTSRGPWGMFGLVG